MPFDLTPLVEGTETLTPLSEDPQYDDANGYYPGDLPGDGSLAPDDYPGVQTVTAFGELILTPLQED